MRSLSAGVAPVTKTISRSTLDLACRTSVPAGIVPEAPEPE